MPAGDHAQLMNIRLSPEQIAALEAQHRQDRDRRVCDRFFCVLLAGQGWSTAMIAQFTYRKLKAFLRWNEVVEIQPLFDSCATRALCAPQSGDYSGFFRLFFRLTECTRRIFPASGRDVPHQADLPCVDFQPLHIQPRHRPTVNHRPAAQHAFKRVTSQELFAHLRITYLWHLRRFIHPQGAVNHRQFFSAHPVSQKTKITHHPEEFLRYMLLQARHHLTLRQGFRRLLTGIVVVVAEAQRGTASIVCQPGARYRRFFQITAQVFHGVFAPGRLF